MARLSPILILLAVLAAGPGPSWAGEDLRFITVATGPLTGVYYPAGRALCDIANDRIDGVYCVARRSAGSVANLAALEHGSAQLAIVQNDVALTRKSRHARQVMRLHRDYLTVIVGSDETAQTLGDLRFAKLYTGHPDSGHRATAAAVAETLKRSLARPVATHPDLTSPALCNGTVRGLLLMVGHPSGMVQEALRSCGARLIGLDAATIGRLTRANPAYKPAEIPGGLYRGQVQSIATIGQDSILMARSDLEETLVAQLIAAIHNDLERMRGAHPALRSLDRADLRALDPRLPVHPGANRYYSETPGP
ncbi:MAG: TAXI family TRAP transporter solute-binding subunit [Alphaproteobacteria bacterium]|nr:MAG: TAXI family TRAP transporter solute-binding subunit [Alphaproteobacteria bacterium]